MPKQLQRYMNKIIELRKILPIALTDIIINYSGKSFCVSTQARISKSAHCTIS